MTGSSTPRSGPGPREDISQDALPMLDHRAGFQALKEAESSTLVRRFAYFSLGAFVVYVILILVLPWQQFVQGSGRVVAYDPLERPQAVEAPLPGRVVGVHVVEGQRVQAGEVLFQLGDNDPDLLRNLQFQRVSAQAQLDAAAAKLTGLRDRLAQKRDALSEALDAADQELAAARAAAQTAELQYDRVRTLFENPQGGLVSRREYELAALERDQTSAALTEARAKRRKAELDGEADINDALASVESARSDSASAAQSLASLQSRVNTSRSLQVVAPRNGIIFRVSVSEGTFLSSGQPMATLVPETQRRVVELWMDGNDIPLVHEREENRDGEVVQHGSPVRLQFEGWPAVQFVGWPSVARGTFGGEVILIDPTDDGTGQFRVLVGEKPDTLDDGEVVDWPGDRWLRQGVQTNGWVLLERVPLWYEIWRQLNGFPPALPRSPDGSPGGSPGGSASGSMG